MTKSNAKKTAAKKTTAKKAKPPVSTKSTKVAKKTSTKRAAKKQQEAPKANTGRRHDRSFLMVEVPRLRSEGMKWEDIAKHLGCAPGLCRLMFMWATVPNARRIKGSPEKVAAAIVAARSNDEAWGYIAARAQMPEAKVRAIFEQETGQSHKEGFRVMSNSARPIATKLVAKPRKAAAKKAA